MNTRNNKHLEAFKNTVVSVVNIMYIMHICNIFTFISLTLT